MTHSTLQYVVPRHRRQYSQQGLFTQQSLTIGISLLVLISLSMLSFFYLQQVLQTASQGSDIHALETRVIELKEKQRSLELESANLRSIHAIEEKMESLNLVTTDRVSYLGTVEERLAVSGVY